MATLDVFNSDAFSTISLTAAIEKVPGLPTMLGDMGIFETVPVRTTTVMIEERSGTLSLVQTDARGNPPKERASELRTARSFATARLSQADILYAHELQNIRAFGSETETMAVQAELARRTVGPTGIAKNLDLTEENMRLGAIQGLFADADGSTLYNWYTELGVSQDAEIDFDLDNASPASGAVRKLCAQVVRQMVRNAQGAWTPGTSVVGLCGDTFWDQLIAHKEVRETYLNQAAAAELRGPSAWEQLSFGGIRFVNYRGTDDNSTVAIPLTKCKFFPVGAPGVFQVAYSPGESFEWVNTPGRPRYMNTIVDRDRNAWVRVEMYSYPLYYCTRPKMLQRARNT
jgi:hypothetical protein